MNKDGVPIGKAKINLHLDLRIYEVEFLNGLMETLSSNIISENILSQVDLNGHRQMFLDGIIDQKKDESALSSTESTYVTKGGVPRCRFITKSFLVCWKDGSCNWVILKDFKNSYPVQLSEHAIRTGIKNEPECVWWIPFTIKRRQ